MTLQVSTLSRSALTRPTQSRSSLGVMLSPPLRTPSSTDVWTVAQIAGPCPGPSQAGVTPALPSRPAVPSARRCSWPTGTEGSGKAGAASPPLRLLRPLPVDLLLEGNLIEGQPALVGEPVFALADRRATRAPAPHDLAPDLAPAEGVRKVKEIAASFAEQRRRDARRPEGRTPMGGVRAGFGCAPPCPIPGDRRGGPASPPATVLPRVGRWVCRATLCQRRGSRRIRADAGGRVRPCRRSGGIPERRSTSRRFRPRRA